MKILRIIFFAGISVFSMLSCQPKQTLSNTQPCDTTKHYALTWSEEFNYTGLPDSSKWGYEEGLVRNNEAQYYTKARPENARVENGMLVIESLKESYMGSSYTSASINSLGKVSFPVNSRVEVKAKLPSGNGIWPAIWMMGTDITKVDWPRCGEIDIMEFLGRTPGLVYGTFHWWDASTPDSSLHLAKGDTTIFSDVNENFHVYGIERTKNKLQFFVDNQYYFEFTTDSTVEPGLLEHPYYLLLNTAIGGSWGGDIDDAIFPQKFFVDWVRVFEIPE
jgi:beta-glucanase (GH16 family)